MHLESNKQPREERKQVRQKRTEIINLADLTVPLQGVRLAGPGSHRREVRAIAAPFEKRQRYSDYGGLTVTAAIVRSGRVVKMDGKQLLIVWSPGNVDTDMKNLRACMPSRE